MDVARVFIGIGSNLGDRQQAIDLALAQLAVLPGTKLVAQSRVYETQPVGPVTQGLFLNAVAELHSELKPHDLMLELQAIETRAGRVPRSQRIPWGPRRLDLDILFYDDCVINQGDLVIPHPHLHERGFVLVPLMDLAPQWMHPQLRQTVAQMLQQWQRNCPAETPPQPYLTPSS